MEHRENARSTYKNIQGGDIVGIYIPNMEKPKGCRWCPLNHDSICYVIQPYKTDETNGEQCRNDCPLIEIDEEAIDIAQDIIDGCKRFKERRADEYNTERH